MKYCLAKEKGMGIYYQANSTRVRPWRACIERHGVRFERWFRTEEEAAAQLKDWERKVLALWGPKTNKKTEARKARQAARAKRLQELDEKLLTPSPCGMIKSTPIPRRCKYHMDCPNYEICLEIASNNNWTGWERV